jgi:class 3 adenylate cyclase
LRFLDPDLERRFQFDEGSGALTGTRITSGASIPLWLIAAFIIPIGSDIPTALAYRVGFLMALTATVCVVVSGWAQTLNQQHFLIGLLTAANGTVILWLASATGLHRGYAVAAIMLLYAYGFISRTRFVFAFMRTFIILVAYAVVVARHGIGDLLLDTFILVAASLGTLVALRRLERDRRRVYFQALVIQDQAGELQKYSDETERLLLNILPAPISVRLRAGESPIADEFSSVSILFADMVGFTPLAARMAPREVIAFLSEMFTVFDELVSDRGLEKIKTIGDSYMVAGGLPEPLAEHADRVVDLGVAMLLAAGRLTAHIPEVSIRVGIHSGPVAGGVIGTRKFAYDVWGDTVNVASRLEEAGVAGKVHVSEATKLLVKAELPFEPFGPVQLQGIGSVNSFLLSPPRSVRPGIG